MRVEIVDREYWLSVANQRLEHIEAVRKSENHRMENLPWYKKMFLDVFEYPSIYGFWTEYQLGRIKNALLMGNTGTIFLDSEEIKALIGETP